MPQMFEVVIRAMGEVRDVDGNLISSEPVEARMVVTEEQAEELGLGDAPGMPPR